MSWSLQISHGDLAFTGAHLGTVSGVQKLVQDLTCAILEPMGTDDLHPTFGSVIDGGRLPDGTWVNGVIGTPNDPYAGRFVESEIQRICANYQQAQVVRNNNDLTTYGRSTLTPEETLLALDDVQIQAVENQMLVQPTLSTGAGQTQIVLPTT